MKLKIWELSLMMAMVITVLWGVLLTQGQQELADKLIRLHVLANSDDGQDQQMKLYVRDSVLETLDDLLAQADGREEAQQVIGENLDMLTETAQAAVVRWGVDYPVSVELGRESYPTRDYDTFSLPAGQYMSLRVEIGAAEGRNWWCVVFPPLCVSTAEGELEASVEAASLTDGEYALITGEDAGYVVKFKALEVIESVKELLFS